MATLDPVTTATQLATAYTQPMQSQLTTQTQSAQKESTALNTLRSALSAFDTALSSLSSSKGLKQFAASFNNSGIATATTTSKAQAGSYQFHVEQLATAHQVVFEDLPAVPVSLGGPITVQLQDGSSFNVNLVAADSDSNGTISQAEIARAINQANDNQGKVVASVVTSGGQTQLLLSSSKTGEGGEITVNASGSAGGRVAGRVQQFARAHCRSGCGGVAGRSGRRPHAAGVEHLHQHRRRESHVHSRDDRERVAADLDRQ